MKGVMDKNITALKVRVEMPSTNVEAKIKGNKVVQPTPKLDIQTLRAPKQ